MTLFTCIKTYSVRSYVSLSWPRGYKAIFMLNSAEHEILNGHKYKHRRKFSTFLDLDKLIMLFLLFITVKTPQLFTFVSPSAFSRRAVVSYWRMCVHEVLVNRLGGLSLPRKSVVRLNDRPDMTLDVYRGRKATMQQQQ